MNRLIPEREPPPCAPRPVVDGCPDRLWVDHLTLSSRDTRDRLVLHYVPLVRALARRLCTGLPAHVDPADLTQSGMFGLIEAIDRFDPARNPRFEGYAAQRIRGAMLDELRALDWVPRTLRGRAREFERARERLEAAIGRRASEREVAAAAGVAPAELRAAAGRLHVLSVEALDDLADGRGGVADTLADDGLLDPLVVVDRRETERQLGAEVRQLGERDRTVVHLYYVERCTLAEIGRRLGVTESRVCQLHGRLVARLRGRLEELAAG